MAGEEGCNDGETDGDVMVGNMCLALETGQDGFWFSRRAVDEMRMEFAGKHEGCLTRTSVHQLHMRGCRNCGCHRSASPWEGVPPQLLLLRPQSRVRSQTPPVLDAAGRGFQNDHIT